MFNLAISSKKKILNNLVSTAHHVFRSAYNDTCRRYGEEKNDSSRISDNLSVTSRDCKITFSNICFINGWIKQSSKRVHNREILIWYGPYLITYMIYWISYDMYYMICGILIDRYHVVNPLTIRTATVSNNFHFSHFVLTKVFVRLCWAFWKWPRPAFLNKNGLFHFQLCYQSHRGLSNCTKFGLLFRWTCLFLDSWYVWEPNHISSETQFA